MELRRPRAIFESMDRYTMFKLSNPVAYVSTSMRRRSINIAWLLVSIVAGAGACTAATKVDRTSTKTYKAGIAGGGADNGGEAGSDSVGGAGDNLAGSAGQAEVPDAVDVVVAGEYPIPLKAGLAPTPPMGWSSWNTFACDIKATDVINVANAIVSSGMLAAGYQYVNIDDCWQEAARDADGNVQVSEKFLTGYEGTMKTLVDSVHALGLKLGLYSDRGKTTCAGRAGAEGYEKQDAATYAAWGIDYLKHDNCASDPEIIKEQYQLMRDEISAALTAAGSQRPIVYSLCAWNFYEWGLETGQLWRTTTDITPNWDPDVKGSFTSLALLNSSFAAYNGPNGWNDPDMLEVGVGNLARSEDEQKSHFSHWAIMGAPLIAGNDVTKMKDVVRDILTNPAVIAVDQDPWGLQGMAVRKDNATGLAVWVKPLSTQGTRAVMLVNNGDAAADITMTLADVSLAKGPMTLTDLWTGVVTESVRLPHTTPAVPPHGAVLYKVQGVEPLPPAGTQFVSDLTWIYAANGFGPVERDMTNGKSAALDGDPITLDGVTYPKGLGVAGGSKVIYRLGKACSRFTAKVNLEESLTTGGSIVFHVYGDDVELYRSPVMKPDSATETIDISVADSYRLSLVVTNGMDTVSGLDRGVWADAQLECSPAAP